MSAKVTSLDHLVLTVASIDASVAFYEAVLGMERQVFQAADGSTRTALKFGGQKINLHEVGRGFRPHAARPVAGSADLCFLTDVALDQWAAHLLAHDVEIEDGPVPRSGATGPIMSLYIRDPDGNLIEISTPVE